MPINSRMNAEMQTNLPRAANVLAGAIRGHAPTSKIAGAVSVGQVTSPAAGSYAIDVIIDMKKAPEARAFEYGSGIHNPRNPGTYEIHPKNVSLLAFYWDKVDKNSPTDGKFLGISNKTGKALFTYVDHPGVAARPYIRPSITEKSAEMRQIIGRAFSVAIMAEMRDVFRVE